MISMHSCDISTWTFVIAFKVSSTSDCASRMFFKRCSWCDDPPWCSEPSERRHVVVVRVVRDACWSEGTAHARVGVVRVVPENCGGEEEGGGVCTLDKRWRRRSICYDERRESDFGAMCFAFTLIAWSAVYRSILLVCKEALWLVDRKKFSCRWLVCLFSRPVVGEMV